MGALLLVGSARVVLASSALRILFDSIILGCDRCMRAIVKSREGLVSEECREENTRDLAFNE